MFRLNKLLHSLLLDIAAGTVLSNSCESDPRGIIQISDLGHRYVDDQQYWFASLLIRDWFILRLRSKVGILERN